MALRRETRCACRTQARDEIERRALREGHATPDSPDTRPAPRWALAVALGLGAISIGLYAALGTPAALVPAHAGPDAAMPARAGGDPMAERLAGLIQHLQAHPDDAAGWVTLAHTYATLGEFAGGAATWARIGDRAPQDPDVLAEWADLLATAADGDFSGEPDRLIGQLLALAPDVVVVATGGVPQNPPLDAGSDLVTSSWDIMAGSAKPAETVLLYDDNGGHQGMGAAELIANAGSRLELVSPERFFAPEMGGMNHVPYMRAFHEKGVTVTINTRLLAVRREGNRLVATLGSDFAEGWRAERRVDQVVGEHGTLPLDDLYLALKPLSRNGGAIDYERLVKGGDIFPQRNPDGSFLVLRIGDAVASRNIHAAIYDGMRFGIRI